MNEKTEEDVVRLGCAIPRGTYNRMREFLLRRELGGSKETQGEFIARLIEAEIENSWVGE